MGKLFNDLPANYQAFVTEYVTSGALGVAAQKAGSTAKNLSQAGKEILKKPEIQDAIREMRLQIGEKLEITAERVLQELARIGFSDVRSFYDASGRLMDLSEMSDNAAAAISQIETSVDSDGEKTRRIRLWDKKGALEDLAKHLGLFDADNTQKRPLVIVKDFTGAD